MQYPSVELDLILQRENNFTLYRQMRNFNLNRNENYY